MFPIFKIYHKKNKTETLHIYVFLSHELGKTIDILKDDFFHMRKEKLLSIFTPTELDSILEENIPVHFIDEPIYIDDNISTIKRKIIENADLVLSFPEIYLFGIDTKKFNIQTLYYQLTHDEELPLTKQRIIQFIQNFVDFNMDNFSAIEQEEYSMEDLFPFTEEVMKTKIAIGQKFIIKNEYPFTVSPFDRIESDPLLEKYVTKITSTDNDKLLFTYGNLLNNNLFMCTAEDVLTKAKKKNESAKMMIQIYFPLLYKENIESLEQLRANKEMLLEKNKKMIDDNFQQYTNTINFFYELYSNKDAPLPSISYGIKRLHFIIHPPAIVNFPVDIIFKLINTTLNIPMLRWNPGSRRENIYRLYAPQTATDGRKIPYLTKSDIIKVRRFGISQESITLLIEDVIICNFYKNGTISIQTYPEFSTIQTVDSVQIMIKKFLNPVLNKIKTYLEQSGYSYFNFESLYEKNIEVVELTYIYTTTLDHKSSLDKIKLYRGCVSSVFNILDNEISDLKLIFKRISNFNEMDSIDAFITFLNIQGVGPENIIRQIEENFRLTNKKAVLKYSAWVGQRQVERDKNRKIRVKDHPGFPIDVFWKNHEVVIEVKNIDNINYLRTLPVYLNSLIKLVQYENIIVIAAERTKLTEQITQICKKKEAQIQTAFPDIHAQAETNFADQPKITVNDGEINFDDSEVDEDLLDMFGGEDDSSQETTQNSYSKSDSDDAADSSLKSLSSFEEDEQKESELSNDDSGGGGGGGGGETSALSTIEEEKHRNCKDIEGESLHNPYYFQQKLEKKDPILFLKQKQGKFKQYSRMCAENIRRQPVVLSQREFEKIRDNSPGKIKSAIRYGSSESKQNWYVCPQYWCLSENKPLTKEDLDNAKRDNIKLCGNSIDPYKNIIPPHKKEIPSGKCIYSFIDFGQKKQKQVKETLYPSFLKLGSHPNPKLCVPCCFNKLSKTQEQKNKKCATEEWIAGGKQTKSKITTKYRKTETHVIKESNKTPLDKGEWGYLPLNIYDFLQIPYTNLKCNKEGQPCILRKGVEYSSKQSFISCISAIYSQNNISIAEMKEIIINALTLDNFITFQHGTLVDSFKTDHPPTVFSILKSYTTTTIYKKLNTNAVGKKYLKEIISAFNNFKNYLKDDNVVIDYEYLWDILCTPNENLFQKGLNLIILSLPENDITQNVNIICPSNHYANTLFNGNRPIAIILLRNDFFEPIIKRTRISKKKKIYKVETLFSLKGTYGGRKFPWSIQNIIRKLGSNIKKKCGYTTPGSKKTNSQDFQRTIEFGPTTSNNKIKYAMRTNISVQNILKQLRKTKYNVIQQIINLHTKTIGVLISDGEERVFVPTLPSPISVANPFILAYNDTTWWRDYESTVRMLNNIAQFNIPCKPRFKVIDDEQIIGILTETNQFVPTHPKTLADTLGDNLEQLPQSYITNMNIFDNNETVWMSTKQDVKRLEMVKRIKLETNFYNTFRNMTRIALNQYKFRDERSQIETIINDAEMDYWVKLESIVNILKGVLSDFIKFVDYSPLLGSIDDVENISMCLNLSKEDCGKHSFCFATEGNDICQILLPEKHLFPVDNEKDNETIYYGRIADELIRYEHIRSFLLEPKTFITFQKINYNLNKDEVLLLESILIPKKTSLLAKTYYNKLVPMVQNPYVRFPRTFYTAEPQQSLPYPSKIKLN